MQNNKKNKSNADDSCITNSLEEELNGKMKSNRKSSSSKTLVICKNCKEIKKNHGRGCFCKKLSWQICLVKSILIKIFKPQKLSKSGVSAVNHVGRQNSHFYGGNTINIINDDCVPAKKSFCSPTSDFFRGNTSLKILFLMTWILLPFFYKINPILALLWIPCSNLIDIVILDKIYKNVSKNEKPYIDKNKKSIEIKESNKRCS